MEQEGSVSGPDEVMAFDTGPGNALVNDWVERHSGAAMDRGGALAASGQVDAPVLTKLLANPYFAKAPPKSLDRDDFDGTAAAIRIGLAGLGLDAAQRDAVGPRPFPPQAPLPPGN